jgi:hypothetical protein
MNNTAPDSEGRWILKNLMDTYSGYGPAVEQVHTDLEAAYLAGFEDGRLYAGGVVPCVSSDESLITESE